MSESDLSPKLARQLAGRCCYGACPENALGGSDYCAPHDAHEKGRDAKKKKKRRQALADKGICIVAGCGRKVGKRKQAGRVALRECARCTEAHRKRRIVARPVPDGDRPVPGNGEIPPSVKLEVGKDGATRTRYVSGRSKGGQSKELQDAEILRDAEYARQAMGRFVLAFGIACSDEVRFLPRYQRQEAMRVAADHPAQAARLLASVAARIDRRFATQCACCGGETGGREE